MKKIVIFLSLIVIVSFSFAQPTVTVQDPTDVSSTSAKLKAKVNLPNGWTQVYNVKVYIHLTNKSTNSTTQAYTKTYTSGNWGGEYSFSKTVTDLSKGTNYEYYASATEANWGTVYSTSGTKAFTTPTDTLKVPSAYSTIQAGLNAATSGDVVLVSAGTYNENIIWPDVNGIKLISAGDSSNTIIDGGGSASVITFTGLYPIDSTTIIKGFGITNGNSTNGAGIYINNCGPIITNCEVYSNAGTGIRIQGDNTSIIKTKISYNTGGIVSSSKGVLIDSCTVLNNEIGVVNSWGNGGSAGGIHLMGSYSRISNCTISNNRTIGPNYYPGGGGITLHGNGHIVSNSFIAYNSGPQASAIFCAITGLNGPDATIKDNIIYNNLEGTALKSYNTSSPDVIRNTFANNSSYAIGGSFSIFKHNSIINNAGVGDGAGNIDTCTIYNNGSGIDGANIKWSNFISNIGGLSGSSTLDAENNFWGHSTGPYHATQNPSGLGDTVTYFADILPFLDSPSIYAPPIPAQNLTLTASAATSASFSWDASKMGDIAGYKFYYDTDSSGYPYANSVDLGNVVTKSLTGLTTGKTYYVAVTTYDTDGNESWYSKEVAVQLNNTPVIGAVSDVTINEDKSSTVTLSATDADGDAITYSAVSDTNAVTISVSSTKLTLTPNANWHGVATIKAYASDGYSKDSTSFKLTVTAVNDAPVISAIPDDSTNEETEKAIVVSASDVEGDALTYSASSDTSAVGITVSSDTLKLMPATNYTGTAKITVVVSDNALKDTTSFNFKVININDAPVIAAVSDVTINEDNVSALTLSATDIDGDAITYSAVSDTNAVTISVSSSTLTLTPNANWNGVANIKAYASDGSAKDSTTFKLTVTSVNDAPTLTAITETLSTDEETVLKVAFLCFGYQWCSCYS